MISASEHSCMFSLAGKPNKLMKLWYELITHHDMNFSSNWHWPDVLVQLCRRESENHVGLVTDFVNKGPLVCSLGCLDSLQLILSVFHCFLSETCNRTSRSSRGLWTHTSVYFLHHCWYKVIQHWTIRNENFIEYKELTIAEITNRI